MYIVTGASGFIGSSIVKELNNRGITDIIAVDRLDKSDKFKNLCDCIITDYLDRDEFLEKINADSLKCDVKAVFHQGACSDTTELDGQFMLKNNFSFSKDLAHYVAKHEIPFVYASSASVYGSNKVFVEDPKNEEPLNVYGYSKLAFDQYMRVFIPKMNSTAIGLRYFNVYGQRELYKGKMASMVYQLYKQVKNTGKAKLFEGTENYANGEQRRDFVCVKDVVDVNLFFGIEVADKAKKGILNCGTGKSRTFNDIAKTIIEINKSGEIEYIPIPESIRIKYQSFTEADITNLRKFGYDKEFMSLEDGIKYCMQYWDKM